MKIILNLLSTLILSLAVASAHAVPITLNFDEDLNGNTLSSGDLLNDVYGGLGVSFNATARIFGPLTGTTSLPNAATGGAGFATDLEIVFDSFGAAIGASNLTASSWTLTAFDVLGNILGSGSASAFGDSVFLSGIGEIKSAVFSTTFQYGIDDLVFVPEPSSIAMIGLGLIGIGFSRRKKSA